MYVMLNPHCIYIQYFYRTLEQLKIASSASYNARLREYVRYGGIRMMKDLNSNMTTLNVKHAGMLIHEMGIMPDTL